MTPDDVKQAVHTALNERDGLDRETHREHHEFIKRWIRGQERKMQRAEKIRTTVIGGVTIMVIGAVGSGLAKVGSYVLAHWHR